MRLQSLMLVWSFLCGLAAHIFSHDADLSPTHHMPIALRARTTICVLQCFHQFRIFFTLPYSKLPRRSLLSSAAIFTRFFFDIAFPGSSMTSSHLDFFCSATAASNGNRSLNVSPSLAQYAIVVSRKKQRTTITWDEVLRRINKLLLQLRLTTQEPPYLRSSSASVPVI